MVPLINRTIIRFPMKLFSGGIDYQATVHQNKKNLPYLLMMHGFMGSGDIFLPIMDHIIPYCNPVTIDLIGHGKTTGTADSERYRTELQVGDIKSILDRLRLSPLLMYGYSMGGRLALNVALDHQDLFNGLILESTTCGIEPDSDRSKRAELDEQRAEAIVEDFSDFLRQWQAKPLFDNKTGSAENRKSYDKLMMKQNPVYMAASLRGFGSGSMKPVCDRLQSLHLPVLLLAGSEDKKFTGIHRKMENEIPNVTSKTIPDAAHRVHLDQPGRLAKEIENFIKHLNL
jgi:2-succinyl-6-hydroxy-2,4-cyclohexadiene-1-carboxylate synthase